MTKVQGWKFDADYVGVENLARELLGLTYDQGTVLFFHSHWPREFRFDDEGYEIPQREGAIAILDAVLNGREEVLEYGY